MYKKNHFVQLLFFLSLICFTDYQDLIQEFFISFPQSWDNVIHEIKSLRGGVSPFDKKKNFFEVILMQMGEVGSTVKSFKRVLLLFFWTKSGKKKCILEEKIEALLLLGHELPKIKQKKKNKR